MNLRSLEYFISVAQLGSFSRAAEQLRIAQPAISRQIQGLEYELGVELLRRTRKGAELTGAGHFFLQRIIPVLEELKQAKDVLAAQSRARVEDIVIGLTTGEGLTVASTLIRRWKETFPAANLRIVEGLAPLINSGLRDGSFDLGVSPEPLEFDGIWTLPMFKEPLVLIASRDPGHALPPVPDGPITDMGFLLRLPLISPSAPNPLRGNIKALAVAHGVEANISLELDSMSIIKDLVRRGIGYALTTYAHIANEIEHQMLRVIPVDSPDCWRNVSLFGLENADAPKPGSATVTFVKDLVQESVAAGHWPGARSL